MVSKIVQIIAFKSYERVSATQAVLVNRERGAVLYGVVTVAPEVLLR
jgi:hypothetical protein